MSGHSKWSKVKHQKATTDSLKAQAFTKASRMITVAVKEGGGVTDPDKNFRLRLAIEKAKEVNMPNENIKKAIERGSDKGGVALEEILYEGYGPYGVAFLILAATDNRQRTVSFVKNILEKAGGSLGSPGSVQFQFITTGIFLIPKEGVTYEEILALALEVEGNDVKEKDDVYELYTDIHALRGVEEALVKKGLSIETSDIIMQPVTSFPITQSQEVEIQHLADKLESLEDVMRVFTNAVSL